jgi:protein subunit release factor A
MVTMEIHPGEGGADAESFAGELAAAVAKHSGRQIETVGKLFVLHRL